MTLLHLSSQYFKHGHWLSCLVVGTSDVVKCESRDLCWPEETRWLSNRDRTNSFGGGFFTNILLTHIYTNTHTCQELLGGSMFCMGKLEHTESRHL